MKRELGCDTEIYENYFLIAFEDVNTRERVTFDKRVHARGPNLFHEEGTFDAERVRTIMSRCTVITFNGLAFDAPIIYLALSGATVAEIKRAANRIIGERLRWWDAPRELGVFIPKGLDHIDLIEPNPAVMQGLKVLNGRLHGPRMQDLPYPHDAWLSAEEMDQVEDYCGNDLDATIRLFVALREPIEMRVQVAEQYGLDDMRSKSDAQLGEAIIKKRVEQATGNRVKKDPVPPGTEFTLDLPDFIEFETEPMRALLEDVRNTKFRVNKDGRVTMPKALEGRYVSLGASTYKMGIGGLHSTEANRAIHSTDEHVLIDADVASQYPSIILTLGLKPRALGPAFLTAYRDIYDERRAAKRRAREIKNVEMPMLTNAIYGKMASSDEEIERRRRALEAELSVCGVRDKGGKIALNGCYGKLASKYSPLHHPKGQVEVCLVGQLTLLMLIERAESEGISVLSGNTDGVVFMLPREHYEGIDKSDRLIGGKLKAITDWWEKKTGFDLEFAEYKAMYNLSVNTYFAIKSDGSVKRKGTLANPWAENDLRGQMSKNPNMTICSDAALAFILEGTDPAETIRASRDIRGFVTVVNVKGGGKWHEEPIGKVVRYAWCHDGSPIFYCEPHPTTGNFKKVSRTDGCRPLMNLPDEFPEDIDYDRYIETAWDILRDIGAITTPKSNHSSNLEFDFSDPLVVDRNWRIISGCEALAL